MCSKFITWHRLSNFLFLLLSSSGRKTITHSPVLQAERGREGQSPPCVCAPSLGRHFDADLSGYRGWASNPLSPSSPLLAMDEESAASEDNNDYLSRKRQKEQASRAGLYLLSGLETYMTSKVGEGDICRKGVCTRYQLN